MLKALKNSKELQLLVAIVVLGLGLRLFGIEHGFPFIFHPDEPAVVRSATGIRFEANPKHFDWPHLHFYLNYFVYFLFIKGRGLLQALGLQAGLAAKFPLLWQDPLVFYWLSRVFDGFLGALTAIPVFLAGRALFNSRAGLLAALAIVLMPLHVHTSHFALIDVPMAFWGSWSIYFAVLAYQSNNNPKNWKNYLLAGLFAGFAASTKYNGGLVLITTFVAFAFAGNWVKNIKNLVFAILASVVGFFVGTPYALLDYNTFIRTDSPVGALWQFQNVGSVDFVTRLNQFFGAISITFASEFGYVFIVLFLVFIIFSVFLRDKRNWLIILPALFLFFYTSGFEKMRSHYFITTYPFVALSVGIFLDWLFSNHLKNKKVIALATVMLFALPFAISFQRSLYLHRKDTKVILYEWLQANTTLNDHMVYNSSTIEPVVSKISKDLSDKGLESKNVTGKKGYIIVYVGESSEVSKEESDFVGDYEKIHEISSEGRRGGNVLIYAFDETQ